MNGTIILLHGIVFCLSVLTFVGAYGMIGITGDQLEVLTQKMGGSLNMIKIIKSTDELQRLRSLLCEEQHLPNGFKIVEYIDKELNELVYYPTFLECNIVQIAELGQYSVLDILYSRYYWFAKFLARYESLFSINQGMRQQLFQIIEAIDIEATGDGGEVSSDLLEAIEEELNFNSID